MLPVLGLFVSYLLFFGGLWLAVVDAEGQAKCLSTCEGRWQSDMTRVVSAAAASAGVVVGLHAIRAELREIRNDSHWNSEVRPLRYGSLASYGDASSKCLQTNPAAPHKESCYSARRAVQGLVLRPMSIDDAQDQTIAPVRNKWAPMHSRSQAGKPQAGRDCRRVVHRSHGATRDLSAVRTRGGIQPSSTTTIETTAEA
ncbi:MAG: hypothetical protein FJ147_23550 [Deltaproteobacteria bacterium]|nr:hypothetical protein [Deltaproteobacteria bacterium]